METPHMPKQRISLVERWGRILHPSGQESALLPEYFVSIYRDRLLGLAKLACMTVVTTAKRGRELRAVLPYGKLAFCLFE